LPAIINQLALKNKMNDTKNCLKKLSSYKKALSIVEAE